MRDLEPISIDKTDKRFGGFFNSPWIAAISNDGERLALHSQAFFESNPSEKSCKIFFNTVQMQSLIPEPIEFGNLIEHEVLELSFDSRKCEKF